MCGRKYIKIYPFCAAVARGTVDRRVPRLKPTHVMSLSKTHNSIDSPYPGALSTRHCDRNRETYHNERTKGPDSPQFNATRIRMITL